jgi:hypothetical protein
MPPQRLIRLALKKVVDSAPVDQRRNHLLERRAVLPRLVAEPLIVLAP